MSLHVFSVVNSWWYNETNTVPQHFCQVVWWLLAVVRKLFMISPGTWGIKSDQGRSRKNLGIKLPKRNVHDHSRSGQSGAITVTRTRLWAISSLDCHGGKWKWWGCLWLPLKHGQSGWAAQPLSNTVLQQWVPPCKMTQEQWVAWCKQSKEPEALAFTKFPNSPKAYSHGGSGQFPRPSGAKSPGPVVPSLYKDRSHLATMWYWTEAA